MIEFDFKRFSRRCHVTERELQAGDLYFSALVEQGDEYVRLDYSELAWSGPPEGAIGWWRSRIPDHDGERVYWAPPEVLLAYFQELAGRPEKRDTYYVMSLVLQQKRLLTLSDVRVREDGAREFVLRSARLKSDFTVPDSAPPPKRLQEIQSELVAALFTDRPSWGDDDEDRPPAE